MGTGSMVPILLTNTFFFFTSFCEGWIRLARAMSAGFTYAHTGSQRKYNAKIFCGLAHRYYWSVSLSPLVSNVVVSACWHCCSSVFLQFYLHLFFVMASFSLQLPLAWQYRASSIISPGSFANHLVLNWALDFPMYSCATFGPNGLTNWGGP